MFRNRGIDHIIVMELISKPGEAVFVEIVPVVVEAPKIYGKPKPSRKPDKQQSAPINKMSIIAKRSRLCDCGCKSTGHDLHHCFLGRRKGVAILDDERNLVLVNHLQHVARMFDNRTWRIKFWQVQCKRYGEKAMLEWVSKIPAKMRSRIDWI